MNKKHRILTELDAAIDRMDLDAINSGLDALHALEPRPGAEDPKLFAARILKMKEEKSMRISKRTAVAVAAVAAVALTGFTVYAATALNLFAFPTGDRYATVRTTDGSMTRQQAESLALDEAQPSDNETQPAQAQTESFTFDSLADAEKKLSIPVIVPDALAGREPDSIEAHVAHFDEDYESRTLWVRYDVSQDQIAEVTISRSIIREGADVTTVLQTDMDEGSQDTYRSQNGTNFTLFTESDPSGEMTAHIATRETGEYSYALILLGYDEDAQKAMLDALDLSVYS